MRITIQVFFFFLFISFFSSISLAQRDSSERSTTYTIVKSIPIKTQIEPTNIPELKSNIKAENRIKSPSLVSNNPIVKVNITDSTQKSTITNGKLKQEKEWYENNTTAKKYSTELEQAIILDFNVVAINESKESINPTNSEKKSLNLEKIVPIRKEGIYQPNPQMSNTKTTISPLKRKLLEDRMVELEDELRYSKTLTLDELQVKQQELIELKELLQ